MSQSQNQIIHADCFDVFPKISDKSINLSITDIPYNYVNKTHSSRPKPLRNLDKGIADSAEIDITKLITELVRITKGSIYIFCEYAQVSDIISLFRSNGLTVRMMIWEKTNPSPMNGSKLWLSGVEMCIFARFPNATFNGHCRNTVLKYPTKRSKLHPTEKPQELLIDLIQTSSNRGDLILDCCAGSGSLAVACHSVNRNFIVIEKNKEFFEIMKSRITKHTVQEILH